MTLTGVENLRLEQNKNSVLDVLRRGELVFKARPEALSGTGAWLLQHPKYEAWVTSSPSGLWCYGAPGVGKSSLASLVIKDLCKRQHKEECYVLYHFCHFASRKQETEMTILQNLLCQIAEKGDPDTISFLYDKRHSIMAPTSTPEEVAQIFAHLPIISPVYLVVDGLDEVENVKKISLRLLSLVKTGFRIFVTSRDHPDTRTVFNQISSIEVYASQEDIKAYVCDRFQESDFADVIHASHDLIVSIADRADGLFVLAKLLMDRVLTCATIRQMRKAMSFSPATVTEAYQSSLERIRALCVPSRDLTLRLISWVAHAERALHPREIIHAFALNPDDDEVDEESLTRLPTLLRNCAGLVILDPDYNTLALVHTTAYEFFAANNDTTKQTHIDMSFTALHYLNLKLFRTEKCSDAEQMTKRLEDFPFLEYAGHHWGRHALKSNAEDQLMRTMSLVLKDECVRSNAFLALFYQGSFQNHSIAEAIFSSLPRENSELHMATYWGLLDTTKQLLKDGADPNVKNSQGWGSLHWAARNGQHTVCQLLLDYGAHVNIRDERGWTPLFWSSFYGHVQAIKLLLDNSADHTTKDTNGWTALHWAVSKGEAESVELLLSHHASKKAVHSLSKARNKSDESIDMLAPAKLLEIAASENDLDIFRMLLDAHFDAANPDFESLWTTGKFDPPLGNLWRTLNKAERAAGVEGYISRASRSTGLVDKDIWKGRLVHSAIKDDQLTGLKLLLELGADPNHQVGGRSPLHAAAHRRNPEYTQILLRSGADVSLVDKYGQTALHQAVICGFPDTVEALIKGCSAVNARRKEQGDAVFYVDISGQTPLMLACGLLDKDGSSKQSRNRIVDLLVAAKADATLLDSEHRHTLHYAIDSRDPEVVQKILQAGGGTNLTNQDRISATLLAAQSCEVRLFELLIRSGVGSAAVDERGWNCFHSFASGEDQAHHLEDLKQLFDLIKDYCSPELLNAEFTYSKGGNRDTPLTIAVMHENWKIVQIMSEAGALVLSTSQLNFESAVVALHPHALSLLLDCKMKLGDQSRQIFNSSQS